MKQQRVCTEHFDIGGNSIYRLIRFYLLSRLIPMGDNRGGPGWKCLLALSIYHSGGQLFYLLKERFAKQLNVLRKLKGKLRNI